MKFPAAFTPFLFFTILVALFFSCKRELSCERCEVNQPPIANAGADQSALLPRDSVMLDGSASTDADGNIISYQWKMMVGPLLPTISSSQEVQTRVSGFLSGVYLFELTVTDNGGLSDKDTVQVRVEDPVQTNRPPLACAGQDQVITLPINNVTLNGDCTTDPDNNITAYQWSKIDGPTSFSLTTSDTVKTDVNSLTEGVYHFKLKVTDADGLSSTDTVQIKVTAAFANNCGSNRPETALQATLVGVHPELREGMAVVATGNKIFYAGGQVGTSVNRVGSSRVDIYDVVTNTWSRRELSVPRMNITPIAASTKVLFAGGSTGEIGDVTEVNYSTVDIYDLVTDSWSVTRLKYPSDFLSAVATDGKVFFAGGSYRIPTGNGGWTGGISDQVEIYDIAAGSWSETKLSEAKWGLSTATLGNKVYFAGGHLEGRTMSNKIEIYDLSTKSWSYSTLTETKYGMAGNGIGDKMYWAGGHTPHGLSCEVEIHDVRAPSTSIAYLSEPGSWNAVIKDNRVVYNRWGRRLDIFDVNTGSWSVGVLPASVATSYIVSANNTLYLATNAVNVNGVFVPSSQIYKLEF